MKKLYLLTIAFCLFACEGEKGDLGPEGLKSLINIVTEPTGVHCTNGGLRIESGIDSNNNGILDVDEVQMIQYVCNGSMGADGLNSLVNVTVEPAGLNCSAGGIRIESGVDTNSNGILDVDEVQITQFVCNGEFDKEVRISFGMMPIHSSSMDGHFTDRQTGTVLSDTRSIRNFNIENYTGIDSVSFSAFLLTLDTNVRCFAELYDKTNNVVIEDTEISSKSGTYTLVYSSTNFINNFPSGPINLSIKLRSEKNGTWVYMTNPVLVLYRTL